MSFSLTSFSDFHIMPCTLRNHWMNADISHQRDLSGKHALKWFSATSSQWQAGLLVGSPEKPSGVKLWAIYLSTGIRLMGNIHIHSMICFWDVCRKFCFCCVIICGLVSKTSCRHYWVGAISALKCSMFMHFIWNLKVITIRQNSDPWVCNLIYIRTWENHQNGLL